MKNIINTILFTALILVGLTGCGASGGGSSAPANEPLPSMGGPGEMRETPILPSVGGPGDMRGEPLAPSAAG